MDCTKLVVKLCVGRKVIGTVLEVEPVGVTSQGCREGMMDGKMIREEREREGRKPVKSVERGRETKPNTSRGRERRRK